MDKQWIKQAIEMLEKSLKPSPIELNEIDWKEDLSINEKKIIKHISAFSNFPGGGFFAFGIENKTGKVIGIETEKVKYIVEKISNFSRENLNPSVQIDYAIVEHYRKNILIIYIKESSVKPVHLKEGSIEDCYIRTGGSSRKATKHEIGSLLLNSKNLRYEELSASKLLSEDEILEKLDYKTVLRLLSKPDPKTRTGILEWLIEEKMVKKYNQGFMITNLGAITMANDLKGFDDLFRKNIRLIKYKGKNKTDTEKEFTGNKGYAIGFESLMQFIDALLPHSEIIRTALRKTTSLYPSLALRELIANAFIHQDFSIIGMGPMIEIFQDRIEISNPGRLLQGKRIDRLIGTSPESRNELLASAFRRFNICEERGSGLQKVVSQIELFGLPPIKFEEFENSFRVTIFAPKKYSDMSQEERIEACYQHSVLKFFSNSSMTNATLRERFKLNEKQRSVISRLIKESIDKGRIKLKSPESKSAKFSEYIPYWA